MIRLELTQVTKRPNQSECYTVPAIQYNEHLIEGYGMLIPKMAGYLINDLEMDGDEIVEVYRDGTLCFNRVELKQWVK